MTSTDLVLADAPASAEDLAGFLARLLRFDRRAAVRLRADGRVLAVFGRPPFGDPSTGGGVLAVRSAALAEPAQLDATVSAGQLLDALAAGSADVTVPPTVTGPGWSGMLPPRTGWTRTAAPGIAAVTADVAAAVAEFRTRGEALAPDARTREALDAVAADIWGRPLPCAPDTGLPLRAAHAAHALGFLRPADPQRAAATAAVILAAGPWLLLEAPYGAVAVRRAGAPSLTFTPR